MIKNAVFYGEFENEQKKDKIKFNIPKRGFEPQVFSNFPAKLKCIETFILRANPHEMEHN